MANFKIIRDLCKQKRITIRELANRVGIGDAALHKIIQNNSTNTTTIEDIAKVLEVEVGIFFDSDSVLLSKEEVEELLHTSTKIGLIKGKGKINFINKRALQLGKETIDTSKIDNLIGDFSEDTFWKEKYYSLLEKYNQILEECNEIRKELQNVSFHTAADAQDVPVKKAI